MIYRAVLTFPPHPSPLPQFRGRGRGEGGRLPEFFMQRLGRYETFSGN